MKQPHSVILLWIAIAGATIATSGILSRGNTAWISDLLMGIGVTALLFVPITYAENSLKSGLKDAQNSANEAVAIATQTKHESDETRAELRHRLEEMDSLVARKLAEENDNYARLFEGVKSAENCQKAVREARAEGYIAEAITIWVQGCQITITSDWSLSFSVTLPDRTRFVVYMEDDNPELFGVRLAKDLDNVQLSNPDPLTLKPSEIFHRLSEALLVGLKHRNCRPVRAVFPQWVATTNGYAGNYEGPEHLRLTPGGHRPDGDWIDHAGLTQALSFIDSSTASLRALRPGLLGDSPPQ